MRLLRAGEPRRERPCAMEPDNSVRDLSAWVNDWSGGALDPAFLLDLEARFDREGRSLPLVDISRERIGAPVRPGQILAIGLNYRKHVEESGLALPKEPLVASKSHWAVCGPWDDLIIPPDAQKTDWEVELGVVIGRRTQYLPDPASAMEHIAGYCTANDLSERSWLLEREGQWIKGKSFESFAPIGPWLVTTREIPDPNKLRLTCHVNGRVMQDANTSDMVFNVPYLIYYLSQCMVLEPGDLVSTGSPAGTALGRPDKPYLREGDVIEVEVCGLGAQRQICRNFRRDDA